MIGLEVGGGGDRFLDWIESGGWWGQIHYYCLIMYLFQYHYGVKMIRQTISMSIRKPYPQSLHLSCPLKNLPASPKTTPPPPSTTFPQKNPGELCLFPTRMHPAPGQGVCSFPEASLGIVDLVKRKRRKSRVKTVIPNHGFASAGRAKFIRISDGLPGLPCFFVFFVLANLNTHTRLRKGTHTLPWGGPPSTRRARLGNCLPHHN